MFERLKAAQWLSGPVLRASCVVLGLALIAVSVTAAALFEFRTAYVQSQLFSRWASGMTFAVRGGPNDQIRFPLPGGPQDQRLGYAKLPSFIDSLTSRDFEIVRQSVPSRTLGDFTARQGYAIYREKEFAGLSLHDRDGTPFYKTSYPQRLFGNFDAIPPLVVNTLLFIEDRSLLDIEQPRLNPAIIWHRFALAAIGQIGGVFDADLRQGGASTIATQIEKFRHYPNGLTRSVQDKLTQMLAASVRSYLDGPMTFDARRRIVSTYINATPLSSRAGYGEVIGIGDGLWAWFGTDLGEVSAVLSGAAQAELAREGEIYKQVLSLLLAQRRPSFYLLEGRAELSILADRYLELLWESGVIDAELRDAALAAQLHFLEEPPLPQPVSFVSHKASAAIRTELLSLLRAPSLYDLDRYDLRVNATFDAEAQRAVSEVLTNAGNRDHAKALGLVGPNLLGSEDPSNVKYSVVLYERGTDRNSVRIHADTFDQPFDLNSGAKLILGSTAKLRTLVTYLDIIARLHDRFADMPVSQLRRIAAVKGSDPLTRWAAEYVAGATDKRLQPMLDAAMQRRYSANPAERFFTGGGVHTFSNFQASENGKTPTVEEALTHSTNLSFIRIMRDIRDFYIAEEERAASGQAANSSARTDYLTRFADQEGRTFLNRFFDDFRDRSADEVLTVLAGKTRKVPRRLAIVFRSLRPEASEAEMRVFLTKALLNTKLTPKMVSSLYESSATDKHSLADRAYLAGVHPLQLWLGAYLQNHEGATRREIMAASVEERQEAYAWLFKTRSARKQDVRIRVLREQDAFRQIHLDWRRQGYPFAFLVPSLATAIGSSGDRPDALAHLMGIIMNDGVELPTVKIEQLRFAAGTPYETELAIMPEAPKRVFAPEVAATVRRALTNVVAEGTGVRFRGAYLGADGAPLIVGGKTGTGDNRFESFRPGQLASSRVVDRTATFVFFLGDRFYGTITAYVPGAIAGRYKFTSSLAVQLLKSMTPQLQPLLDKTPTPDVADVRPGVAPTGGVVRATFERPVR
jgi:membrane peptidoglycan carboxypeptidase